MTTISVPRRRAAWPVAVWAGASVMLGVGLIGLLVSGTPVDVDLM